MDPGEIFFGQLKKCGVDYFDYYLLHNVNENSIRAYCDEEYGIVPFFLEQKRLGRIRHLGFSCHGFPENLEAFLDKYGDVMEFCQIQLNYLDWSLQDAERKYAILSERGMPIWVMEPMHGGLQKLMAEAPQSELSDYAIVLRAMTQARGSFTMYFERYSELPGNVAEKVIAAHKAELEEK